MDTRFSLEKLELDLNQHPTRTKCDAPFTHPGAFVPPSSAHLLTFNSYQPTISQHIGLAKSLPTFFGFDMPPYH
jgi:hypothetical protein